MSGSHTAECDKRWAKQIQDGNRKAFEALFRAYTTKLSAFAGQLTGVPEVAEELVQDLFLNIWQRRKSFSPEGSVKSYLYAAMRNRALNYLKRQRVEQAWKEEAQRRPEAEALVLSGIPQAPDEALYHAELMEALKEAIEKLPERRRLVFTLSRQHGLTYREIATALGISIKTVETQMSRAFRTIRKALAAHVSSPSDVGR